MKRPAHQLMRAYRGQTRNHLSVEQLESRVQPGSVLPGAADWCLMSEFDIPRGESSIGVAHRHVMNSSDGAAPVTEEIVLGPGTTAYLSGQAHPPSEHEVNTAEMPAETRYHPAVFALRNAANAQHQASPVAAVRPTTDSSGSQVKPAHAQKLRAVVQPITLVSQPLGLRVHTKSCDSVGTKASVYNSYGGAAGNDANLAVASGKGPNLGKAYAVGHEGLDGSVNSYMPNGASEFSMTISGTFNVEIRDVAVNTNGIYVAGTDGGGSGGAFILRLNSALLVTGSVSYAAPPGGFLAINGIGLSPNGAVPDVFVTGLIYDPNLHTYAVGLAHSFDLTLTTPRYSTTFNLGGVTEGFSIDADRSRHAYIGGRFAAPGGVFNVTLRINSGGLTSPWSTSFLSLGHPDEAMHGVKFLGGSSSAGGVYAAGLVVEPSMPGFEALMLAKLDPATGQLGPNHYAVTWTQPGINWSGWDIVADRLGNAYVANRFGHPADFDARIDKFDPTGGLQIGTAFLGGPGSDDRGMGIDLETTSATANVFISGATNTPTALMFPLPSGCDPTSNGGYDGFAAVFSQPL